MTDVTCTECGSPHRFFATVLCATPFCQGRMSDSVDEYVPSRVEATRNMTVEPEEAATIVEHPQRRPQRSPHQDVLLNLPESAAERKEIPMCTGVLDYFPAALAEVARLSLAGNRQHNPGEPLHWARGKSTDQADTIVRHLMQRGTVDTDGVRHSAKVAWRALALLQEEI